MNINIILTISQNIRNVELGFETSGIPNINFLSFFQNETFDKSSLCRSYI